MVEKDLNPEMYTFEYYIIAVETSGLYQCVVYRIGGELIRKGENEINSLLKRIAWHNYKNEWNQSMEEAEGYITL
jgi:hypothetical protein